MTDGVLETLARQRVLPVVVIDRAEDASSLAEAVLAGGLSCIEITLRTPAAEEVLRQLSGDERLLVGAGTVVGEEGVERALAAGARFIVSPGFSRSVVGRCQGAGVTVLPGTATATEVQAAVECHLTAVKFFPAEAAGGPAAIRALAAPFPDVRFVPTGGVSPDNLGAYLSQPAVLAAGGSWMVSRALMQAGAWGEIARLSRAAFDAARTGDAPA